MVLDRQQRDVPWRAGVEDHIVAEQVLANGVSLAEAFGERPDLREALKGRWPPDEKIHADGRKSLEVGDGGVKEEGEQALKGGRRRAAVEKGFELVEVALEIARDLHRCR